MKSFDCLGLVQERNYGWELLDYNERFKVALEYSGAQDDSLQRFVPQNSVIAVLFHSLSFMTRMLDITANSHTVKKVLLFAKEPVPIGYWKDYSKVKISAHMDITGEELDFLLANIIHSDSQYCFFPFGWLKDQEFGQAPDQDSGLLSTLTDREMEVLLLVAEGASNHAIADLLMISENTAKTHVRRILEKLQLNSRTKAALYAKKSGLIR